MDLQSMIDALRDYAVGEATSCASGELIVQLSELITLAEAARSSAIGIFDACGEAAADGTASTASWLRDHCRLDLKVATGMVHTARALRELPATAAALESARISYAHAVAIASLTRDVPVEIVVTTEDAMVVVAELTTPSQLRSHLARYRHTFAPEAVVRDEQNRYARRGLELASSFERLDALSGWLDPEVGGGLRIAIEAKLGPPEDGDLRNRSQKWHDAFGQLVRDFLDRGELSTVGGERPHITVTADISALQVEAGAPSADLDRYGPISGQAARRIACDAILTFAVLAGPSQVLDIGRASRIVPSGLRRALALRDKGCVVCGAPASWCDAHHVIHWADGGETKLSNLALLCPRHHRRHHEGRLSLHPKPGGGWSDRPPPGERWGEHRKYPISA